MIDITKFHLFRDAELGSRIAYSTQGKPETESLAFAFASGQLRARKRISLSGLVRFHGTGAQPRSNPANFGGKYDHPGDGSGS